MGEEIPALQLILKTYIYLCAEHTWASVIAKDGLTLLGLLLLMLLLLLLYLVGVWRHVEGLLDDLRRLAGCAHPRSGSKLVVLWHASAKRLVGTATERRRSLLLLLLLAEVRLRRRHRLGGLERNQRLTFSLT